MYIELNAANPAAPSGAQIVHFRADSTHLGTAGDPRPVSAFVVPSLTAVWIVPAGSAATANSVGPVLIAPRVATFTRARLAIKTTDKTNSLTVAVCQNGTSVFTMTVAAGATGLQASVPAFTVAADDLLTLNITAGSAIWDFSLQLETA